MRLLHPVLCLLGVFVFALAGCRPGGPERLADPQTLGELRVATRVSPISYQPAGEGGQPAGFEYDLVQAFARELGVPVRVLVQRDSAQALDAVMAGEAHLALVGAGSNPLLPLGWSAPLLELELVVVGQAGGVQGNDLRALAGRRIGVRAGSQAEAALVAARRSVPGLRIQAYSRTDDEQLLTEVAEGRLDFAAVLRLHYALALHQRPDLEVAFALPSRVALAWARPPKDPLGERLDAFIGQARQGGLVERIVDRYFGHTRRLSEADIATFLARIQTRLPAFRADFEQAGTLTGLDWRLLAALAYQESHWDPLATSPTGVRGMMMLTNETADRLGVSDRLDPKQAILGGARYFAQLRDLLPAEVAEADRNWMAVAAYNLGMGHLNGARAIARELGRNDNEWFALRATLPLLARADYASRLKSGRARGGEAVVTAENVRSYYSLLSRVLPQTAASPFGAPVSAAGLRRSASAASGPGLRSPGAAAGR